ncbi:MAG: hypothetical protein NTW94_02710 [Legionellales bacterium]|nr:hypothetical protein [Legionellales bacterium]
MILAKELTKAFESFVSGRPAEISAWLLEEHHIKGEFVLIIPPRGVEKDLNRHEKVLSILLKELPLKQAVKLACHLTEAPKNELYLLALTLQKKV